MNEKKNLWNIELNSSIGFFNNIFYTRVPGGWLCSVSEEQPVFIPYSEEFKPVEKQGFDFLGNIEDCWGRSDPQSIPDEPSSQRIGSFAELNTASSIDDETPKSWDSAAKACERLMINNRPASNFAALLIKNENFWRCMRVESEEACDKAMKANLEIASKADLDRDEGAYNRFMLMFGEYSAWMQKPEF